MKKTKLVLGIFIAFLLFMNLNLFADGTQPPGTGEPWDPYQVSTLDHLLWISTNSSSWDGYFSQTADINASSTSGWNGGYGFSPIGTFSTEFMGYYNGQEHSIDGLFIDRPATDYVGLFGYVSGATIDSIGVTNVDITGDSYVGGLVGESNTSIVKNSYSTGSVRGTAFYVGGLVGGNVFWSNVSNSYSTCSVIGSNDDVGGLVGYNRGTVSNCYSAGSVTVGLDDEIGGLVGCNSGTVTNCYSTASVSGGNYFVGGLVGLNDGGTVTDSFWDTETSGQASSAGGTGKTTAEMKLVRTFTDVGWSSGLTSAWDFELNPYDDTANDNYWDLDNVNGTINNGYPFLSWQNGGDVALPVELSSFTACYENNSVLLQWTTESEAGGVGFIIDRRTAGTTEWHQIVSYLTDRNLVCMNNPVGYAEYTYTDNTIEPNTTYSYRLSDVDIFGNVTVLDIIEILATGVIDVFTSSLPEKTELKPAYPNPFNPQTKITYRLAKNAPVDLLVYNVLGQQVRRLVAGVHQSAGKYEILWDGLDDRGEMVPGGTYVVVFKAGEYVKSEKVLLLH